MEEKLHVLWMKKQRLGAEARLLQNAHSVKCYLTMMREKRKKTRLLTSRVNKARTVSLNFQTLLFLSYCGAFLASELVTCTCSNA